MNGRLHLLWELVIDNDGDREIQIESVFVDAGSFGGTITHEGERLAKRMRLLTDLDGETLADLRESLARTRTDEPRRVPPGRGAVYFGWAEAPAGTEAPVALEHRVRVDGVDLRERVEVDSGPVVVLAPPLRGAGWVSFGSPSDDGPHRRTVLRFGGEPFLAQRYAIDFGRVDEDGRLVTSGGDPASVADYVAYGADVLAVGGGVVVEVNEGVPEQSGDERERAVPITLKTVAGNYVILRLDSGEHAIFAHLQPASIVVREGQRVRRGEPLGRLGSSGNATGPHLHFHLCDRPALLACEGIPYVFDRFGAVPFEPQGESVSEARLLRSGESTSVEGELVRDERILDFRD